MEKVTFERLQVLYKEYILSVRRFKPYLDTNYEDNLTSISASKYITYRNILSKFVDQNNKGTITKIQYMNLIHNLLEAYELKEVQNENFYERLHDLAIYYKPPVETLSTHKYFCDLENCEICTCLKKN